MHFLAKLVVFGLCLRASAYCPEFIKSQTTCSCAEYVDGAIIKCDGPNGPMVVEKLKENVTEVRELTLTNANIIEIGALAFKNLRIKKLVLDNNRIKTIQRDAFYGLESTLQELSINNNQLTEVPTDALGGLRALNILSLRCNEIGNMTGYAFQALPSLIDLNLGCNKICNIGADAFHEIKSNIQNIILDNNCLRHVPVKVFENMNNLIGLHIKYNKINKLSKHNLQQLPSLTMLSLIGNNISHIDAAFLNNITSLRYLYISENRIKHVESEILKQFESVEIFDLSYNYVPDLTTKQFSVMKNLQHLNLEGNRIKEIAAGAFASTPLILLWLPYNCLTNISADIFHGIPFLKQLSLAHNNILNVQPYSFAHLANLHTIDLSHNKIVSLQKSSLIGPDFLAVRVEENPLVCNQEDGFHVMNGHEAINLTTEVNAICKTDYKSTLKSHKCPTYANSPERPTCCKKTKITVATSVQPKTMITTPATSTVEPAVKSTTAAASKVNEQQLVAAMEAAAKLARVDTNSASVAAERARKLNMERFMRLSRKPVDSNLRGTLAGSHTSNFLERQRGLLARPDILEKNKISSVDAPVEFNADPENETVAKEEERAPANLKPIASAPVIN